MVREPLARLGEVRACRGAAVGVGQERRERAVRVHRERFELDRFEVVRAGGREIGLDARDAGRALVPRDRGHERLRGAEVGLGRVEPPGRRVALRAEQEQLAERRLNFAPKNLPPPAPPP